MLSLNSNNYQSVQVFIRGLDDPIILPAKTGTALMEFLTNPTPNTTHVKLNSEGNTIVVRIHDISRVEPLYDMPELEKSLQKFLNGGK